MNTLVYSDVSQTAASHASTIASALQQTSMRFGAALASLLTTLFIPDRFRAAPPQLIHGIHLALQCLGGLTVLSTHIFRELHDNDGASVSRRKLSSPI